MLVIGEHAREAWDEGGADTNWCCSSNGEARNGAGPVHASHETELTKLLSKPSYEKLAELCQVRIQEQKSRKVKHLPLYMIHPTTQEARK